ncbi:MAG: Sec-independent protein translocase protein TatB [Myxococcota bacterium]|nr:Sec-independent protein translocase protein TatB [Myxococcota bacterium]
MFGLGLWEITLILVVSLLVLGPKRLPQLAKQLARFVQDMRRAASDIQMQFEEVDEPTPVHDEHKTLHEAEAEAEQQAEQQAELSQTPHDSPPKPKL